MFVVFLTVVAGACVTQAHEEPAVQSQTGEFVFAALTAGCPAVNRVSDLRDVCVEYSGPMTSTEIDGRYELECVAPTVKLFLDSNGVGELAVDSCSYVVGKTLLPKKSIVEPMYSIHCSADTSVPLCSWSAAAQ